MSSLILLSIICLAIFATLAVIDGFYLHIWKFALYQHAESRQEHLVHAIRATLFPFILVFVFLYDFEGWLWYLGVLLVFLDIVVLTFDMYLEKDSRLFMGGLPRWEYMLHMFVNGFHFAGIALIIAAKSSLAWHWGFGANAAPYHELLYLLTLNLLPGSVLMMALHWAVLYRPFALVWLKAQHVVQSAFDPTLKCCKPNPTTLY